MHDSGSTPAVIRFGVFEADVRAGELRKSGVRVRMQEQPFQILLMLLERPTHIVTRDEIRQRLWPGDVFVDFEHSVNSAVARLREMRSETPRKARAISKHCLGGDIDSLPRWILLRK